MLNASPFLFPLAHQKIYDLNNYFLNNVVFNLFDSKISMKKILNVMCLIGVILLTACASAPHGYEENKAKDIMIKKMESAVLIVRLPYGEFSATEKQRQFQKVLLEKIQKSFEKGGIKITVKSTDGLELLPSESDAISNLNPTHLIQLHPDKLLSQNGIVQFIEWIYAIQQKKSMEVNAKDKSSYVPVYKYRFRSSGCAGPISTESLWVSCSEGIANHMVERAKTNGF